MGSIPQHVFVAFDSYGFSPPVREEKLAAEKLLILIEEYQVVFSIPEAVLEETSQALNRVKKFSPCSNI